MSISWEKIQQYSFDNPPIQTFKRKEGYQEIYEAYKKGLEVEKITPEQAIINKYFINNNNLFLITNNEFPYDLEEPLQHLVIWIRPGCESLITREYIINYLNNITSEYVIFENLQGKKSIPGIQHYQLFVKDIEVALQLKNN